MNSTQWEPIQGQLMTPWAEQVDPACPLPEYPRPMMAREHWMNLNGLWDYAVVDRQTAQVDQWEGKILVPYAIEAALSGVKRALLPEQRLWYRRSFQIPVEWAGSRVALHFGAVDFEAEVWVNERRIGLHRGGYLPFSFDITSALVEGENSLTIAVWDPTDAGMQERGKQKLQPTGIWYTPVSGIWQTVWLEPLPETSIRKLRVTPDFDRGEISLAVTLDHPRTGLTLRVDADCDGIPLSIESSSEQAITVKVPKVRPWRPEDPYLYPLRMSLWDGALCLDHVESYFAMRKFSIQPDEQGNARICLNNQPIFLYGPLDQGYYPDGLYTPATEAAMIYDIDLARKLGFNFIRKHVKVEPQRWYAYCDRVGMIVWQDMPNGGKAVGNLTSILAMHFGLWRRDDRHLAYAGRQDEAVCRQYTTDLIGMIDALYNHPCIAVWVPFNEGWGQFRAGEAVDCVKAKDATRLVDATSGWFDQNVGDFLSQHQYVLRLRGPRKPDPRAFILSEFGGCSRMDPEHAWNPKKKSGYKFYKSREELTAAYVDLIEQQLMPLIPRGLAAAVYTETTDVEIEVNGFVTYDRKEPKMNLDAVAAVHRKLMSVK